LVCPSHESTAATATGGFAAERRRMQQISISSCVRQAAGAGIYQQIAGSVMLRADGGG